MPHYSLSGEEQLPIQRSIMNLDKETGISIMKIVPKLDAGPVMMKKNVQISEKQTSQV